MAKAAKDVKGAKTGDSPRRRLDRSLYEHELYRLQAELVTMQEWVREEGARVLVLFEGRDAAGKGSAIKRVTAVPQPARGPHRRAARADRPRAWAVVLPALRRAPAGGRRDRADGPFLVQPRPASSGSWASARRRSSGASWRSARSSSGCSSTTGSCCASTGSRSVTRSRRAGSAPAWTTRCAGGSSRRWTSSRSCGGRTTRGPRTRCSCSPTSPSRRGGPSRATTSAAHGINMIAHLLSSIPYYEVQRPPVELPPRPAAKDYERPPRELFKAVPGPRATLARHA